ncbi:hypothetical protein PRO82_000267 [Candidatus Protochlamydia amoebophila]|nr:hypothetical protein [Candidatus Protochlamydia amoebophila]
MNLKIGIHIKEITRSLSNYFFIKIILEDALSSAISK